MKTDLNIIEVKRREKVNSYSKLSKKKCVIYILIIFISLIVICLGIKFIFSAKFLHISNERITRIFIGIEESSLEVTASANADINDKNEIEEVIDALSGIKIASGGYSVDDLEGESPSA